MKQNLNIPTKELRLIGKYCTDIIHMLWSSKDLDLDVAERVPDHIKQIE